MTAGTDPLELLNAVVAGMGGEYRAGQQELAVAVADAFANRHHLMAEAPTGSGKSLAYLAPAVASGLTVVVATSTIALQSQLANKDLPALQAHAPFEFAVLKGRSNYLCRAKLRAAAAPTALFEHPVGADFPDQLVRLREFAERADTGDRSELHEDMSNAAWAAVSCSSIECPGKGECNDGDDCFAERARSRAYDASILVVNHALYCAHLASNGQVLPEHDIVVLDEAHAFADNATNAFAGEITSDALNRLAPMLFRAGVQGSIADGVRDAGKALNDAIEKRDGVVEIGHDPQIDEALLRAGELLASASATLPSDNEEAKRLVRLAAGRLEVLRRLAAPEDDDVVWVEQVGRTRRLRIAPVEPGTMIRHRLLAQRPVIAISATLGGDPPFTAVAHAMGFAPDDYRALRTESSFDWRAQGMLYVAKDLPEPSNREKWVDAASDRLCELVASAGGRTLVLCTSYANVNRFTEVLRARTTHTVLSQGDRDAGRLIEQFLADETSVLVGTRSFWAGIDAAGAACVLVVIDKIPFPVPDEPLHAARRQRAEARRLEPFVSVDLPAAALVLAQGAGRLIRNKTDRGVVAVLDRRLATKTYRRVLLSALPPLRRSIDLDEVRAFLTECAGPGEHIKPI